MEKAEPTFVPEWLKSSGGLISTSHQFTLSSLNSGVSKSARKKSLDKDLGLPSVSDRTTSSYFRRASFSNGSTNLRPYSSFNRNHLDDRDNRDWDKDVYVFRNNTEKLENSHHQDYSDPLNNILPSRSEKDELRRSHSSLSGKCGESWPKKVASDLSIANKSTHSNESALLSGVKTSFERAFPSLGADEKQMDMDVGQVPSSVLSSAIQSLLIGSSVVIGGDGWISALAEVPVIVGKNGNDASVLQPVQSTLISATTSMTGGRNMAETLVHGPPKTQTAPQSNIGTQRLEELAVKQSRQLIPMTPCMSKALALNASDKPKMKTGHSQLQSSHLINNPHTPQLVTVKPDVSKISTVGKLLVLKLSRERNGTAKESLSPTGVSKLLNNPVALPSVAASAPLSKPGVVTLERRPSSQAQSRSNFFNLMRKKSITTNSSVSPSENPGEPVAPAMVQQSSETRVDLISNGNLRAPVTSSTNNGKNQSGPDAILYSEEEEARFLRSLGWDETAEEEGGLTEEEISSFYQNYMNLKPASNILKGTQPGLLMPMGEISSDSKVDV